MVKLIKLMPNGDIKYKHLTPLLFKKLLLKYNSRIIKQNNNTKKCIYPHIDLAD